jgi:hypothetical protein
MCDPKVRQISPLPLIAAANVHFNDVVAYIARRSDNARFNPH